MFCLNNIGAYLIIFIFWITVIPTFANRTRSDLLKELMLNYQDLSSISPNFDNETPTLVSVSLLITSFDSVNEYSMDYTMTLVLTQRWTDPRLQYNQTLTPPYLELGSHMDFIWVPGLYFANAKHANLHTVTDINHMMYLTNAGHITYKARFSVTASCPMNLQLFPFDTQICPIVIKSFTYMKDNVELNWEQNDPAMYATSMHVAGFTQQNITTDICTLKINTEDDFACIHAGIILHREPGYYILHLFLPMACIVVISWISFWLGPDAAPARISLGILTVLTITTKAQEDNMVNISYVRAADVWIAGCEAFVFAALLEYAVVSVYQRHVLKENDQKKTNNQSNGQQESKICSRVSTARRLDKVARIVFPVSFSILNVVFWSMYLTLY